MGDTITCKFCHGKGFVGPVFVDRSDGTGELLERIECTHCGCTGVWDAEHLARYEAGRAHRQERIAREESLRECASRLGISPAQLCNFEQGRAPLPERPATPATEATDA